MGSSAALEISKLQLILCSYLPVTFLGAQNDPELNMDVFGLLFIEPRLDRDMPAIAHVYVRSRTFSRSQRNREAHLLTLGSANWHQFERELDRLQCELDDIRREAQLRFADSSAKRYRTGSGALRLLRGRRYAKDDGLS